MDAEEYAAYRADYHRLRAMGDIRRVLDSGTRVTTALPASMSNVWGAPECLSPSCIARCCI